MPGTKDTIRLIVVTTSGGRDDEYCREKPLPVIFVKVLREVGGQGNQEPFSLESSNEEPSGWPRTAAESARPRSDDCLSRKRHACCLAVPQRHRPAGRPSSKRP